MKGGESQPQVGPSLPVFLYNCHKSKCPDLGQVAEDLRGPVEHWQVHGVWQCIDRAGPGRAGPHGPIYYVNPSCLGGGDRVQSVNENLNSCNEARPVTTQGGISWGQARGSIPGVTALYKDPATHHLYVDRWTYQLIDKKIKEQNKVFFTNHRYALKMCVNGFVVYSMS